MADDILTNDDNDNGNVGGRRHKKHSGKRHGNASLRSWVTFVKKVQKEEHLPYKQAMMRAKVRKDKGEKWRGGGGQANMPGAPAPAPAPAPTPGGAAGAAGAAVPTKAIMPGAPSQQQVTSALADTTKYSGKSGGGGTRGRTRGRGQSRGRTRGRGQSRGRTRGRGIGRN